MVTASLYEITAEHRPVYPGDPLPWYAELRLRETGQFVWVSGDCATEAAARAEVEAYLRKWGEN